MTELRRRFARCAWPLALITALALVPRRARADDATGGADDVLVRGRSAGGFVSRAREGETPREVTDLASLIEPLPGVHVRRLGADDSFATLSIRGTSSSQVAVYLAGVPLSGGADPTLDLGTLPLWPGAQVRVHRSFAPAALGRGSLGGTLVLEPPSPRAPARTEVWTGIGSYGQRRVRIADVRGDPDGVRVATGLSASRSDDDFEALDPNASTRGDDVFLRRENSRHAAASGMASVALPITHDGRPAGAVTLTALAQGRNQELPGPLADPTPLQRLDSSRLVGAAELSLNAGPGVFGVRGWGRREGLALRDAPSAVVRRGGPSRTDDAIVAAGASAGYKARSGDRASLEVRLDGSAERYAPGAWSSALTPPSARRTNGGVALDADAHLGAARALVLAASGRADTWHDEDGGDGGASRTSARPTGHVGAELALGPVVLAAHGGMLARPASFTERFGNRGAFLPQPGLRPESATTLDAGARVAGRLGQVRVSLESAAFATWADDLIVFVNQGAYGRARAENIGTARLAGLESELRVTGFGSELSVSHTALASENGSVCRFVSGACERPPLPGRPAHDLVVDVAYAAGPLRFRYGVDVVTGIRTTLSGDEDGRVPDRALHGAGVRLEVPGVRGLTTSFDVRNLFDLRVVEYTGVLGPLRAPVGDVYQYPLPGRRVLLTVRWLTN
jgi:vitamin B12 transporter